MINTKIGSLLEQTPRRILNLEGGRKSQREYSGFALYRTLPAWLKKKPNEIGEKCSKHTLDEIRIQNVSSENWIAGTTWKNGF